MLIHLVHSWIYPTTAQYGTEYPAMVQSADMLTVTLVSVSQVVTVFVELLVVQMVKNFLSKSLCMPLATLSFSFTELSSDPVKPVLTSPRFAGRSMKFLFRRPVQALLDWTGM